MVLMENELTLRFGILGSTDWAARESMLARSVKLGFTVYSKYGIIYLFFLSSSDHIFQIFRAAQSFELFQIWNNLLVFRCDI